MSYELHNQIIEMNREYVTVFAPSSVANVGCGYDTIGFAVEALGEEILLSKRSDSRLVIKKVIGAELSTNPKENVATIAIQSMLDALGSKQGFDLSIHKLFKPGSGLGSSASSAAGAVFAANYLLGEPYSKDQLLLFALEGEAYASKCYHADNVAPSLLGDLQVIRSYDPLDWFTIAVPSEINVLLIFPDVPIKTAESKQLVPGEIPVSTARNQWGNVAGLVHAFHTKDYELLKDSISDCIAEPVRKKYIPLYEKVKQVVFDSGAVGFNISGSGPCMFALFHEEGKGIQEAISGIKNVYKNQDFDFYLQQTKVDKQGCRVIQK